ncbi:DUF3857 domain-containing protein [Hymenobacter sp. BT18]|uniref:DUF3857 domain-containing protein n=1 Tax=Hymenobacter sp. BT18 TaxID=2835648 RepID=UPI00143EED63|nr:DUF3857 domain-containing protein [Hymenobacter sp. BT18]QIX62450.1 DUF3857 domain-containing protein [Hymenobacter sp. BT18]
MNRFSLLLVVSLVSTAAQAGTAPKYPVAAIPSALRENAHAVVRLHDETFTVKSAGQAVSTLRYAITILDADGDDHAVDQVDYDRFKSISYLRGSVYDAEGKLLRTLRAADVRDVSTTSDISLAEDSRARIANLQQGRYPYTVEFEEEYTTSNTLFYPVWHPVSSTHLGVEQSQFRVKMPKSLPALRYREKNLPTGSQVRQSAEGNYTVYEWSVAGLPAFEPESYSLPAWELLPAVYTAPATFEVQNHAGNLSSWEGFGTWEYTLNEGRGELPASQLARMQELAQRVPDVRERVRQVYEYLQTNTRYISIQLGLGGWQTIPAAEVAAKGYGDCKALSNYGMALLKAAGVPAYCALAGADRPDIQTDFPSNQFNHVILCVPLPAARPDTVWLECTSQTSPFNYLSGFTAGRHVLLLTPAGGKLVRTPVYKATDNTQFRRAELRLDDQGNATASVRTRSAALQQDDLSQVYHQLTPEDQKKQAYRQISLPSFTISRYTLKPGATVPVPVMVEHLELSLPRYATVTGKRVFVVPNVLNQSAAPTPQLGERQTDVWQSFAYLDADTVQLKTPAGFRPENLPAPVQLSTAFGTYSMQLQALSDGSIQYIRRLQMNRGRFPKADYPAYLEFRRRINKADKTPLVFLKNDV